MTVDATGRITSIANGSCGGGGGGGVTLPFAVLPPATGVAATDTAAVQAAVNAVPNGGKIWVPSGSPCYAVTSLNLVGKSNLVFEGNGPASCFTVAGSAGANWADLSGTQQIVFRDLAINGSASMVPNALFFWANTTTAQATDLIFDHVLVSGYSSVAHFYAYGGKRVSCRDSTFTQLYNGAANANPSLRTTVVRFDAQNSAGLTSANATTPTGAQATWDQVIDNCWFIDQPAGFGNGTADNNSAFDCVTCGATLTMHGGGIECVCADDLVIWWFSENLNFDAVTFVASDGSVTVTSWIEVGGGVNGQLEFDNDFFSVPMQYGAFLTISAPVAGRGGGVGGLRFLNPDIGGNTYNDHLVSVDFSCTSPAYTPALQYSTVEGPNMSVVVCGNVDPSVNFRGISTVIVPPGATNSASASWGPP